MKMPRVRLAWVMVSIALIAIDLGVLRENHLSGNHWTVSLLILGVLPMANALIVGLLISRRLSTTRPFFLGFEMMGMMALASFVIMTIHPRTYPWIDWYTERWLLLLEKTVTRDRVTAFITLAYLGVMIMLCVPQLVFAFLCGLLSNRIARSRPPEQPSIAS